MKILVTGGLGYIGAHVVDQLAKHDHAVTVVDADDLSPNWSFVQERVDDLFTDEIQDWVKHGSDLEFDVIIHLAALISVEKSVREAGTYWRNNMTSLFDVVTRCKAKHLIFASTGAAFQPGTSPYANTKIACERFILDARESGVKNIGGHTIFRFFNVAGCKKGIEPTGQPTHLIRRAALVAQGRLQCITVSGTDYDTHDGTAVRDYIHVEDIARSIANAVTRGPANTAYECLGTGTGSSVLDVIESMKRVSGNDFSVTMGPRRQGDAASMVCPDRSAYAVISKSLDDMCLSAYENV